MKILKVFFLLFIILLVIPPKIKAVENPFSVENNKFGIHIISDSDLEDANNLVNSSGGDWGYVTIVIREDERDHKKWQKVFDKMRNFHLIPIVRLATTQKNDYWTKPSIDEINKWIVFLDSLNWVIKNRYVVIGNEPNHSKEWGGTVSPIEYGRYFIEFSKALKNSSQDYFVMMAGFDASAPNDRKHMNESVFIKNMIYKYSDIFNYADGWISHSYPNPNFSASADVDGPKSVKTFDWELNYLKTLGVNKDFPVFITETGWAHNTNGKKEYLEAEILTDYYKKLFEIYLKDDRIVAFTPFLLNYNFEPFEIFSWKKPDGSFYSFYDETRKINKITGKPVQIIQAQIIMEFIPKIIKEKGNTYAVGVVKNIGQAVWFRNINVIATEKKTGAKIEISPSVFSQVQPGEIGIIRYRKIE